MLTISTKVRGALAPEGSPGYKNVDRLIERQVQREVLMKFAERTKRGGKGLGARRNTITPDIDRFTLNVTSTLRRPRTTGKAWLGKNVAILKSMAPRVAKRSAERIAAELNQ